MNRLLNASIHNNTANDNTWGVYLASSSGNILSNITANSNDYYGVYLYSSSDNIIKNSTLSENVRYDLYFVTYSDLYCNNVVENISSSG